MFARHRGVAMGLLLLASTTAATRAEDLRKRYGTPSAEAAQHIDAAIRASRQKQYVKAREAIDAALKADPNCQMACFWKGTIAGKLGDLDEGLAFWRRVAQWPWGSGCQNLRIVAAQNVGMTLGRLGRWDESAYWMTLAVLLDPEDESHSLWKSYRNLALTLRDKGDFMSAFLAAMMGHEADPEKVEKELVEALAKEVQGQEVARVLRVEAKPVLPEVPPARGLACKLAPVKLKGTPIAEKVWQLLSDQRGRFALALPWKARHYYLIEIADPPTIRKVAMEAVIRAGCLAGEHLYLALGDPGRIAVVAPDTGRMLRTYELRATPPKYLAAMPSLSAVYFNFNDSVHRLDLFTGRVNNTNVRGGELVAHPSAKYLFTGMKTEKGETPEHHTIIVHGRPVFMTSGRFKSSQWALVKLAPAYSQVVFGAMRDHAAAQGHRVVLSMDGRWVAMVGRGGFQSKTHPRSGGKRVAILAASDLGHVAKVVPVVGPPVDCAIHPVTGQIAVSCDDGATVMTFADSKAAWTLKKPLAGPVAWSGDGGFLFLADKKKGLLAFRNELSDAELAAGKTWWREIKADPLPLPRPPRSIRFAPAEPVVALGQFAVRADAKAGMEILRRALSGPKPPRPMPWRGYTPYAAHAAFDETSGLVERTRQPGQEGLRAYGLRKLLAKYPRYPPLLRELADALLVVGKLEDARQFGVLAVRGDAGRTDLTIAALHALSRALLRQKQDHAALYCLGHALALDRSDTDTVRMLRPLLAKQGHKKEWALLPAPPATRPAGPGAEKPPELPKLPAPPASAAAMKPELLYPYAVASVVLIRRGDAGSGSGVCVGASGVLLTNEHVVEGGGNITVTCYAWLAGTPRKIRAVKAKVIRRWKHLDLAVLRVGEPVPTLVPLPVAASEARPGEVVCALGSPGLEKDVLAQSLTQGAVRSTDVRIEGRTYVEHTAAINPGNSGGPLLNARGHVVGINTLAGKEGRGFAVGARIIRKAFAARP